MKSPFPGMDPYLEQYWRDVHSRLVLYACDQIEEQLPGKLIARVEERIVVEPEEGDSHSFVPDVRIVEKVSGDSNGGVAVLTEKSATQPVVVYYDSEPETETFINIIDPGSKNRLVTVIEILSPTNKLPGGGQNQYRRKQAELRSFQVSLVEIDLLRSGKRVLSLPAARIPRKVRTPYQVCVRRGWSPGVHEVYAVPLREPLPAINIPLRKKDKDARLDLQTILDQCYRKGRYSLSVDYQEPPEPPLASVDANWADRLLRKAGKRG